MTRRGLVDQNTASQLYCAHAPPGDLVQTQILIQKVCGGPESQPFSQVLLMFLVHGSPFMLQGLDHLQAPTYSRRRTLAGERSGDTTQAKIFLAISFHFTQHLGRGQGKEDVFPILEEEPEAQRKPGACPLLAMPRQYSLGGLSPFSSLFFLARQASIFNRHFSSWVAPHCS